MIRAALAGAQHDVDTSARSALWNFAYTVDGIDNVAGGARRGTVVTGVAAGEVTLRLGPLVGWHGMSLFASVFAMHGGAPSDIVGDVQGVSSLQAPPALRLMEIWVQQNLLADRLSILVGRYDINSEFYRLQSGDLFLNSSLGIGPEFALSGVAGPSTYPNTAVGGRIEVKPSPNVVWRAAVLDGVPVNRPDIAGGGVHLFAPGDGALIATELAALARPDSAAKPRRRRFLIGRGRTRMYSGKLAVGGWYYAARLPDLVDTMATGAPELHRGSGGAYLIADATLWSMRKGASRALTAFAQLGVGDDRVNPVGGYTGAGLLLTGPFTNRAQDEIGIAIARAHLGSHLARSREPLGSTAAESTLEMTYLAQFSPFALQPDLQYVIHPSARPEIRSALVLGVRGEWSP